MKKNIEHVDIALKQSHDLNNFDSTRVLIAIYKVSQTSVHFFLGVAAMRVRHVTQTICTILRPASPGEGGRGLCMKFCYNRPSSLREEIV